MPSSEQTSRAIIESTCSRPEHAAYSGTLKLLLNETADLSAAGIAAQAQLAERIWRQALGTSHAMLAQQRRFAGLED